MLVKADDPNDPSNQVLLFAEENCPLDNVSEAISNANRCLSESGQGSTDYETFKLAAGGSGASRALSSSVNDELLNLDCQPKKDPVEALGSDVKSPDILVPVAWGAFHRFDMTDIDENGAFNDPYGLLNECNGDVELHFSEEGDGDVGKALTRRQFDPAQCQSAIDCHLNAGAASLSQIVQLTVKAYNVLCDTTTWTSRSQRNTTSCDETRNQTARGLMRDMPNAVTAQGEWSSFDETWCDNRSGLCVDLVATVYEKGVPPKQSC